MYPLACFVDATEIGTDQVPSVEYFSGMGRYSCIIGILQKALTSPDIYIL